MYPFAKEIKLLAKVKLGAGAFGTVFGVTAKCDERYGFAVKIQRAPGKSPAAVAEWEREMRSEAPAGCFLND